MHFLLFTQLCLLLYSFLIAYSTYCFQEVTHLKNEQTHCCVDKREPVLSVIIDCRPIGRSLLRGL